MAAGTCGRGEFSHHSRQKEEKEAGRGMRQDILKDLPLVTYFS
jgi:hypothetical protein